MFYSRLCIFDPCDFLAFANSIEVTPQFLSPSLLSSKLLAEATAVAELQHANGGGGWPQQQLYLTA